MKIVINLSEEIIEYVKNNGCLSVIYNDEVAKAITNGTPLPKGEWLYEYDDFYHCSRCGHVICTEWDNLSLNKDFPFCHCGADMRKENEA